VPRLVAATDRPASAAGTDAAAPAGWQPFPALRFLSLVGNPLVVGADVAAVAAWPALEQLLLWDTPLVAASRLLDPALRAALDAAGVAVTRHAPPPLPRAGRRKPTVLPPLDRLVKVDDRPPDFTPRPPASPTVLERLLLDLAPADAELDPAASPRPAAPRRSLSPDPGAPVPVAAPAASEVGTFFLTSMGMDLELEEEVDDAASYDSNPGEHSGDALVVPPGEQGRDPQPPVAPRPTPATLAAAKFASVDDLRLPAVVWAPHEALPPRTARAAGLALRALLERARTTAAAPPRMASVAATGATSSSAVPRSATSRTPALPRIPGARAAA
jgi:hypothetical protein